MITQEPTKVVSNEWNAAFMKHKNKLRPNRKNGTKILNYLRKKYVLTEIFDKGATDGSPAKKLPEATAPRTFFLENTGKGEVFYKNQNICSTDILVEDMPQIFVGIDTATGSFTVEGSTLLWDEINTFRTLDEKPPKKATRVSKTAK